MWYVISANCLIVLAFAWRVQSFHRRLLAASDAAHNHFEALRKVRQRGV